MQVPKLWLAMILILCFAVLFAAGCRQREVAEPLPPPAVETPPAEDPEARVAQADLEAGRQIYMDMCASCHGETGTPIPAFADTSPDFSAPEYQDTPPETIFRATRDGVGDMPAFDDRLTDDQIWDVTAFVRSL